MIGVRGQVGIRQYLPGKTHKHGLELYKVHTTKVCMWNFRNKIGNTSRVDGLSRTESSTVSLIQKVLNTGSTIYSDNFYSSALLAEYLKTF